MSRIVIKTLSAVAVAAFLMPSPGAAQQGGTWVGARNGQVPSGAIAGGSERGRTLYICRAPYRGGLHPGKLVGRNCNIGWGGKEVTLSTYEVLVRRGGPGPNWAAARNGQVPGGAVRGGGEGGRTLYVCRARYSGGIHPGKLVGRNCNIGWGGKEIALSSYEVAIDPPAVRPQPQASAPPPPRTAARPSPPRARAAVSELTWRRARNGQIPSGAVSGGSERGRALYICRAYYRNGTHPGKIVGRSCNIGWGGKEVQLSSYEAMVAVGGARVSWASARNGRMPDGAVRGGGEGGRTLYICRARYSGGIHPGKVVGGRCNIGWGGKEIALSSYEVAVDPQANRTQFQQPPGTPRAAVAPPPFNPPPRAAQPVSSPAPAAAPGARPAPDGGRSGDRVFEFVNNTGAPVEVVFGQPGGGWQALYELQPGQRVTQSSRDRAVWAFGRNGYFLRQFEIRSDTPREIYVEGQPARQPPASAANAQGGAPPSPDGARPGDRVYEFLNNGQGTVDLVYVHSGGQLQAIASLAPQQRARHYSRPGAVWAFGQSGRIVREHAIQPNEPGPIMVVSRTPPQRPAIAAGARSRPAERQATSPICWKDSYGRGVGTVPQSCAPGKERIGLLCYDKCPRGMKRVGFDCHSTCPSGFSDQGLFCRRAEYGRGVGFAALPSDLWDGDTNRKRCERKHGRGKCEMSGGIAYPKCKPGYKAVGCCLCRPARPNCRSYGMKPGIDLSCAKVVSIGRPVTGVCGRGEQENAGLCYDKCRGGYKGIGPVCWANRCKAPYPVDCGAGCATSTEACVTSIVDQSLSSLDVLANATAVGKVASLGVKAARVARMSRAIKAGLPARGASKIALEASRKGIELQLKSAARSMGVNLGITSGLNLTGIIVDASQDTKFNPAYLDPTGIASLIQAFDQPLCADVMK